MSETVLNELLGGMSDKYDKRPGHLVHDFLSAVAHAVEKRDEKINVVESKLDVRNLEKDELDLYITQNSDKTRHQATHASVNVTITGSCSFSKGDIAETPSGVQFEFVDDISVDGTADTELKAVIAGSGGNVRANTITQTPVTIQGLTSITNAADAKNGYDKESDQHFLERFLEGEQAEETQGNKAQHKSWAKSVLGVGDAKVFPLENTAGETTDNSVLTIIVDSNILPASNELVATVQNTINPLNENGHGSGLAPLGCYAYIKSADVLNLNITFSGVLAQGATNEQAVSSVIEKLKEYLKEVYKEDKVISFAQIGVSILSADEVDDYSNLQINGSTDNITVPSKSVAVIESVVIS
ncbi:baseplate J/gp47 family protein [Acidaminobacter sp. JC074]|uniref:baseplate J/gp47 family protein n=1 Tax=Acidaminobacter sp. JC074 TaxID=2530199 RepID=UPI001F0CDE2C|nr:baseplate J/gp47 family protein [Acidaminobacter sp. JC074]MCH4891173.1 baseplate J/gp47 family protein [Acidaminobacter sp. JC074]